jgi:hypothetical protein
MEPLTTRIVLGIAVCLWLLFCVAIYRKFRSAAWLAASTGASCLFFLGATIAASFLVAGALFLLPLWISVAALIGMHLYSANRRARESFSLSSSSSNAFDEGGEDEASNSALSGRSESEMYI